MCRFMVLGGNNRQNSPYSAKQTSLGTRNGLRVLSPIRKALIANHHLMRLTILGISQLNRPLEALKSIYRHTPLRRKDLPRVYVYKRPIQLTLSLVYQLIKFSPPFQLNRPKEAKYA